MKVHSLKKKIFLASLLLSQSSFSMERFEFYNGVRSLAMGGTQIAIVNDETALLSNPAALVKLRNSFQTVADPEWTYNALAQESLSEKNLFTDLSLKKFKDLLKENNNKYFYSSRSLFPSLVFPQFGLGIFSKKTLSGIINESDEMSVNSIEELSLVLGCAFRFWQGRLKMGFNVKFNHHLEVHQDIDLATYTGEFSANHLGREGFGISSDLGIILTLPWKLLPTAAVTIRDVGNTEYSLGSGLLAETSERPETFAQTVDVALGIYPIIHNHARMSWSLEMKDLNDVYSQRRGIPSRDRDLWQRVHLGGELNLYDAVFFRAGLNQGYWTAGVEMNLSQWQIQWTSYGEEIGISSQKKEDRRNIFKLAYRF